MYIFIFIFIYLYKGTICIYFCFAFQRLRPEKLEICANYLYGEPFQKEWAREEGGKQRISRVAYSFDRSMTHRKERTREKEEEVGEEGRERPRERER